MACMNESSSSFQDMTSLPVINSFTKNTPMKPIYFLAAAVLLTACKPSSTTNTTTDQATTKTTTSVTTPASDASAPPPASPVAPVPILTQANLDKVETNMSKAEVEAIFGQPTSSHDEPIPIVGGTQTTYNYQSGNSAVTILFKNDQVKEKSGTFNP